MTRHPLALALGIALTALAPAAGAATIQVTTADDSGTSSTCTLRQAIAAMNAKATSASSTCANSSTNSFGTTDTIEFAEGVTSVILADSATSELLITDADLTITGTGMGGVTIARPAGATNPFRIFRDTGTTGTAFDENLTLSGLTISNGATTASAANGGAIFMQPQAYTTARLALTNCVVSGNSTTGANAVGGAISGYVIGPAAPMRSGLVVTLTGSTISGNSTGGPSAGGGAIYAGGVTVKNSIITGNSTKGNASPGGAIQSPSINASNSTISHNSTAGDHSPGGGIAAKSTVYAIGGFGGNYDVVSYNTTAGTQSPGGGIYSGSASSIAMYRQIITNNSTSGNTSNGGGVYVASYYGVSFNASTISGNSVTGPGSSGGGIWSRFGKGVVKGLTNSTLSGNSATVEGGGISINMCASLSSTVNFYNSTMAFNSSGTSGGGVYVGNTGCPAADSGKPTSAAISVTSTIVSNEQSGSVSSSDIAVQSGFALTVNTKFALIQNVPPSGITFVNANNSPAVVSLDPLLKPLANNGCGLISGAAGASECTPTLAIGCRSPAYGSGFFSGTDQYDERGTGFPRRSNSSVDIGAYEDDDEIFCDGFEVSGAVQ